MPDRWVNPQGWAAAAPTTSGLGIATAAPATRRSPLAPLVRGPPGRLVTLAAVAITSDPDADAGGAAGSTPPPTGSAAPATVATTLPTTTTAPPTTVETVEVPRLVGMDLAGAKAALADRGLRGTVRYRSTAAGPRAR